VGPSSRVGDLCRAVVVVGVWCRRSGGLGVGVAHWDWDKAGVGKGWPHLVACQCVVALGTIGGRPMDARCKANLLAARAPCWGTLRGRTCWTGRVCRVCSVSVMHAVQL
jgi:hypothetical protein